MVCPLLLPITPYYSLLLLGGWAGQAVANQALKIGVSAAIAEVGSRTLGSSLIGVGAGIGQVGGNAVQGIGNFIPQPSNGQWY